MQLQPSFPQPKRLNPNLSSLRLLILAVLWLGLVLFIDFVHSYTDVVEAHPAAPVQAEVISSSPQYGVNFISWARATPVSQARYDNGKSTGAAWNRWPLYWNDIEQTAGQFSWAYQDVAAHNDVLQGLNVNAILLGTPLFYTTGAAGPESILPTEEGILSVDAVTAATPEGLYASVFTDGTDLLGEGKTINPDNRWARFVYTAVSRYKPGGVLAQANDWPAGAGITHWEMWNEPDLSGFWDGTTADYARLLQVGYLAAKQADPDARVLFGGLANNSNNLSFYEDVMAIFDTNSNAGIYDYYHDIVATHNYLYAWRSWYHVWRVGNTVADRDLEKPIWLNETGVSVWNDYPGPVCEPDSPYRATMSEQADFIIQSAFYAAYAGADNIFFFQLYDDCGNVGGNHEWYPVEECVGDPTVDEGGDAFGLFRNTADSVCYSHHPQAGTARPSLAALQTVTTYLTGVDPLWRRRPGSDDPINGPQEWVAFYQPATQSRVLGLWSRFGQDETAVVPATNAAGKGMLIGPDMTAQTITAVDGFYTISLPAATNQNAIWDPTLYPIGGTPAILIERDTVAPTATIHGPVTASTAIDLTWGGSDDGSGMAEFDVWVSVEDNLPQSWLTATTAVSGTFASEVGHIYTFTVIGRDKAGNESAPASVSVITLELNERTYLPLIQR